MLSTMRWMPALLLVLYVFSCMSEPDPIDTIFHDYQGDRPGAAVMVIQNGEIVLSRTYGLADLENQVGVTDSSNFRLASMTKAFTAMTILQLVDAGELYLDTRISEIFPDFPEYGKDISISHLLHHTSGLLDYEPMIVDTFSGQVLDRDVLDMMMLVDSTKFTPGSDFDYSNSGYALLSLTVERISGLSFPDYLDQNIFKPAGMVNSIGYLKGEPSFPNRAMGYYVTEDTIKFRDQSTTSAVLGDGGVYSSLKDLYRWDQILYTDQLLSEALMDTFFTPHLENYACGWRVDEYRGLHRVHHSGSTSGFRNIYQRFPDKQFSVFVLTNRQGPDAVPLANQMVDHFLFNE